MGKDYFYKRARQVLDSKYDLGFLPQSIVETFAKELENQFKKGMKRGAQSEKD